MKMRSIVTATTAAVLFAAAAWATQAATGAGIDQTVAADGFAPRLWKFLGVMHPMVVHFPIALLTLAGLFVVLRIKFRAISPDVAFYCLLIGTAAAVVSSVLGWSNAEHAGYGPENRLLFFHRWVGVGLTALAVVTSVIAVIARSNIPRPRLTRAAHLGMVACAAAVGLVGHWGGELAYGEGYVANAIRELLHGPPPAAERPAPVVYPPDGVIDFATHVKPILEAKCLECHGSKKPKGDVQLTDADAFAESDVLDPDAPEKGILAEAITTDDPEFLMPPPKENNPLTDDERKILMQWIAGGADWPKDQTLSAPAGGK